MNITTAELIKRIDTVAGMAAQFGGDALRIKVMGGIDTMRPSFGPAWTGFATTSTAGNVTGYTVSPEQFAAYLAAKRAFAVAHP